MRKFKQYVVTYNGEEFRRCHNPDVARVFAENLHREYPERVVVLSEEEITIETTTVKTFPAHEC